jgi:CHAD domain-containing protein
MTPEAGELEREIKFAADVVFELPNFKKVVGSARYLPQQALNTAYFDTPDLRLWQRGLTLRHRLGEEAHTGKWTLKIPEEGTDTALDRTELSWDGMREETPPEALAILAGVVRRAFLGRVVVLESRRRRLVLRDGTGSTLGEIDDDVVTVAHGSQRGLRFRQIEFEFGPEVEPDEPNDMVDAVLRKLRKAGARPEREQKFAKALGLPDAMTRGRSYRTGRQAPLEDVIGLSIAGGLERLIDYDYRLRVDPSDPPVRAVHQARVACRRLRSDLKTFAPLLDQAWFSQTTSELRWVGEGLGRVRDLDVMANRLREADEEAGLTGNDGGPLQAHMARQRHQAGAALADVLRSERYLDLLDRLHAAAADPPICRGKRHASGDSLGLRPDDLARHALPVLVQVPWKELQRRVRKAGTHPTDRQLHRIRIGAKQLRYAAEAASPVIGKDALRTARRAEDLQTVLGDHHDAVAAEEWLRLVARDADGKAGFAAGLRVAHELRLQRKLRRAWHPVWDSLSSEKATRWLTPPGTHR